MSYSCPPWFDRRLEQRGRPLVDYNVEGPFAPQTITRHGEDVVVVMATKQYAESVVRRVSIVEFFAQSPLGGVDLAVERHRSESWPIDL